MTVGRNYCVLHQQTSSVQYSRSQNLKHDAPDCTSSHQRIRTTRTQEWTWGEIEQVSVPESLHIIFLHAFLPQVQRHFLFGMWHAPYNVCRTIEWYRIPDTGSVDSDTRLYQWQAMTDESRTFCAVLHSNHQMSVKQWSCKNLQNKIGLAAWQSLIIGQWSISYSSMDRLLRHPQSQASQRFQGWSTTGATLHQNQRHTSYPE